MAVSRAELAPILDSNSSVARTSHRCTTGLHLYDWCTRRGGLLPLSKSRLKTIAVLGPSANDTAGYERCFDLDFGLPAGGGCLYSHIYRGYSSSLSTPLMGISSAVEGTSTKVLYASGAAPGQPDGALRNSKDASGVVAAAALAAKADVAIVVVGLVKFAAA